MLVSLSIRNFALIDEIDFNPSQGLNVITGETGAGKSLLVDALGALTGKRIGREVIRSGCDQATIEAIFDDACSVISDDTYAQYGITKEDDNQIILSRMINSQGRSVVRINGKILPLSALKDIGPQFIDIHGQHDQQAIFSVSYHIDLLDRFSGEQIIGLLDEYTHILSQYKSCISQIQALGIDPIAKERRLELLQYQVDEINNAKIRPGEEEHLLKNREKALLHEKSIQHFNQIEQLFDVESHTSAIYQLQKATQSFAFLNRLDDQYVELMDRYTSLLADLEDIETSIHNIRANHSDCSMSSEQINERLDQIYRLKDKYGSSLNEILDYSLKAEEEIAFLKSSDQKLKTLHAERIMIEKHLLQKADAISSIRKDTAKDMSDAIQFALSDLGMPHAQFFVSFDTRPKPKFFSSNGYDLVSFLFTANPGEPLMPLEKIASGGEASRIMLAIKTILSQADRTHTLVFDEIDSGISGDTATKVSEKLHLLSRHKQVLCVTHTAQIAAMADTHFYICKGIDGERTLTQIKTMNHQDRVKEVARLLSGESEDFKSIALSEQLISRRTEI